MSNPMTKEEFDEFSKHFLQFSKHFGEYEATKEPDRSWVGLTDEDRVAILKSISHSQYDTAHDHAERILKAVEAKLKEKNG